MAIPFLVKNPSLIWSPINTAKTFWPVSDHIVSTVRIKNLNSSEKTKWAKFQTEAQENDPFGRMEGRCRI